MSTLLLDTNIVSFVMKGSAIVALYEPHLRRQRLSISFMTVAELYEGACRAKWGKRRRRRLEEEIARYLVFPYSIEVCQCWGEIRALRRRQPIAVDDAWIAATALVYDCPLVTHNPADFRGIPGLKIITAEET